MNARVNDQRWFFLAVILGVLGGIESWAAEVISDAVPSPSFVLSAWGADDGLPHENVSAILQDSAGYLWLGTENGLCRFDGIRFVRLGLQDGLPSLRIQSLFEDREGALWIGTRSGLSRLRNGELTTWTEQAGLAGSVITSVTQAADGTLWVGTTTGLSRWRDGRFTMLGKEEGLTGSVVRALLAGPDGTVWVSILHQGLLCWRAGKFVPVEGPPGTALIHPYCLMMDQTGRLWAGLSRGVVLRKEPEGWKAFGPTEGLPAARIVSLTQGADSTVWVGTFDEGVYYQRGEHFISMRQRDGLSDDGVTATYCDNQGSLWIGTGAGGLNRIKPGKLSTLVIREGETCVRPISLAESGGTLWVGTKGRGLFTWRGKEFEQFLREPPMSGHLFLSAILATSDGSLWWGSGPALFQWKDDAVKSAHEDGWLRGDVVRCLCEERSGGIFIGTQNGQLKLLRGQELAAVTNGLPRGPITDLAQQKDGTLWIASYGGGLRRVRDSKVDLFTRKEGLPSNLVLTLLLGTDEALWVGTEGGGLCRIRGNQVATITSRQGLPDDTILQIQEDQEGNLWLGSQRGICRVARGELDGAAQNPRRYVHPLVLGRSDGMFSEQCVSGFGASTKTRSGRLCFSTARGVVIVDPKAKLSQRAPPEVRLEEVLVDGETRRPALLAPSAKGGTAEPQRSPAATTTTLRMPPGKRRYEFHYTALNLEAPTKVRFKCRLDGVDSDWVEVRGQRTANYGYLPPGRYRFRVTACNGDGFWSKTEASLDFIVLPYWWQRWWFIALEALTAIGAGLAVIRIIERRRVQRQLQKLKAEGAMDRERTRIARDIHDDLGARLTKITLLTRFAERELPNNALASEAIQTIRGTAQEMITAMDETVWAVNPRNDVLPRLTDYILQYAQEFFRNTKIRCRLVVKGDLPSLPVSAEERHNFFLVIKEALNNVAKHAAAQEVEVRVEFAQDTFRVVVRDKGCGFAVEDALARSRGLENMKSRLHQIGGTLDIQSVRGSGTTIAMELGMKDTTEKQIDGVLQ